MGNLRWNAEAVNIINPENSPFLHIEKKGPEWGYVASAGYGLYARLGKLPEMPRGFLYMLQQIICARPRHIERHMKWNTEWVVNPMHVPLLPALDTIPPAPISVRDRVDEVVAQLMTSGENSLIDLIRNSEANLIRLDHGRFFGDKIATRVKSEMEDIGYEMDNTLRVLGRNHRITDYWLRILERP